MVAEGRGSAWHFVDREALLAAVAERGFAEMARGRGELLGQASGPRERLRALGIAYVRFALAHPAYLSVRMFGSEVPDKGAHPAVTEAVDRTFEMLVQGIREAQATGHVRSGDPRELAVAAWRSCMAWRPCSSTGASVIMPAPPTTRN